MGRSIIKISGEIKVLRKKVLYQVKKLEHSVKLIIDEDKEKV